MMWPFIANKMRFVFMLLKEFEFSKLYQNGAQYSIQIKPTHTLISISGTHKYMNESFDSANVDVHGI